MTSILYKPTTANNPGEVLQQTLDANEMSQKDLATRTGLTPKTINEIIKGKNPITHETAIKFERVFGVSASFWNNLQKNYQEYIAQQESLSNIEKQTRYLDRFACYAEMVRYGWVQKTRKPIEKVVNLLTFFRVDSLELISDVHDIAFRKKSDADISNEALSAWIRQGEIEAEKIETEPFDEEKLKSLIPYLRNLTVLPAEKFCEVLVEECRKCGVAVVFVPALKKTYVNGATRWINKDKAILQLSLRNKYADIFWFSFFHELAHILLHGKRDQFIDIGDKKSEEQIEQEADTFAQEALFPKELADKYLDQSITPTRIVEIGKELKLDPGIIAGRLAHDGVVEWKSVAHLRSRLQFVERNQD